MLKKLFKKKPPDPADYERAVLDVLVLEFPHSDRAEFDEKIRRRLRRQKLGPWDEERVKRLRRLKDDVQKEITPYGESEFWQRGEDEYARLENWDREGLHRHFAGRHPEITDAALEDLLTKAIYNYYLR